MNVYFLVEGEQTEIKVYPAWLKSLIPELTRVSLFNDISKNNYYLFSGKGIPSIYTHIVNAIKDINRINNYNYLIVSLDSDELSIERRIEKLFEYLAEYNTELNNKCKLRIIVQNPCIETWFLGNRRVCKRNPQGEKFRMYLNHYNVRISDPELMESLSGFNRKAHFHESYLKEMLKEYNIRYSKSRPNEVIKRSYLEEITNRIEDTNHLKSFSYFLDVCEEIRSEIRNSQLFNHGT